MIRVFHLFINLTTQDAEAAEAMPWARDLSNAMQDIVILNDFVPSKDVNMTSPQRFSTIFF